MLNLTIDDNENIKNFRDVNYECENDFVTTNDNSIVWLAMIITKNA